jgi:hypothetical protein
VGTLFGGSSGLLRVLPWRCSLRRRAAVRHDGVRVARAAGDALTRIGRHDVHEVATAVPGHVPSITSFTSLDAVRGFAGDDYEQAVVEEPPGRHSTGGTNGSHTIR